MWRRAGDMWRRYLVITATGSIGEDVEYIIMTMLHVVLHSLFSWPHKQRLT